MNLFDLVDLSNYMSSTVVLFFWESNKIITKKEINSRNYKIIKRMEVFQSYIFMTITLGSVSKK